MFHFGFIIQALFLCTSMIKFSSSQADGNIHLLKEEISKALENCSDTDNRKAARDEFERRSHSPRSRRSKNFGGESDEEYSGRGDSPWVDPSDDKDRIDSMYYHDRRYVSDKKNSTNRYDPGDDIKSVRELNRTTELYDPYMTRGIRKKRFGKASKTEGECLSQCVFANLQIVNDKGVPKEAQFTKLIEEAISSQQSRVIVENLIRECFKELATESEDNECSYSNALERCMNLQLKKRKSLMEEDLEGH